MGAKDTKREDLTVNPQVKKQFKKRMEMNPTVKMLTVV